MHWQLGNPDTLPMHTLRPRSSLVNQWSSVTNGKSDVFCYKFNDEIWVVHEQLGAIQFDQTPHIITAYPPDSQSLPEFVNGAGYVWLPLAYQYWGIQVLHASAVTRERKVLAFVGPTQVGKSTLAYGFSKRRGWKQIADDRLAFSTKKNNISLIPIDNKVRLRPASETFFAPSAGKESGLEWPQSEINLQAIYWLVPDDNNEISASIRALGIATAQKRLLSQAYALATVFPNQNRQMMLDYLELASRFPVFELRYARSFARFEETIKLVENHLQQRVQ